MAMTEEEIKALLSERDELKKQLDEAKKNAPSLKSEDDKNAVQKNDVIEQLKAKKAAEEAESHRIAKLEDAVQFNQTVEGFLQENKTFLPDLAVPLFEELNKRTYSSPVAKAQAVQKSLLDNFFSLQENVEALPKIMQDDLARFKALADDEKEKQAGEYWKLIPLTLEKKLLAKKAEEVKKANGGFVETNDTKKAHDQRFFAMKTTYLGEENK